MTFLRDLFRWFFWGVWPDSAGGNRAAAVEPVTAHKIEDAAPEKVKEDDVFAVRPMGFLAELRSIRPMSKAFEEDRKDMIEELRKLAPRKKTKPS